MVIEKPAWIKTIISWLPDWEEGEWFNVSILGFHLKAPPISIMLESWTEGIFDALFDLLDWIYMRVEWAYDTAVGAAQWIWDTGNRIATWVEDISSWFWDTFVLFLLNVIEIVDNWFYNVYGWLVRDFLALWDWVLGIDDWFNSRFEDAISFLDPVLNPIIDFFDFAGEEITELVNDPPGYIWNKLKGFLETVADEVLDLMERILEKVW